MTTVDSKGRIVVPKTIREQLGIGPGSEVTVRTEHGQIILEPEESPERVMKQITTLIEEAKAERTRRRREDYEAQDSSGLDTDLIAEKQREIIRNGATQDSLDDRENTT